MKTTLILSLLVFLAPVIKAQRPEPFNVNTGNDLLRNFRTCDAVGKVENALVCLRTAGFVEGAGAAFNAIDGPKGIGALDIPSGVQLAQVDDVVRRYLENHPETRNEDSLGLIYLALVEAWPGTNAPKNSQGSGRKPTIDKETCAKIAAQPDSFAKFGGISNDNAICKDAFPDLYKGR